MEFEINDHKLNKECDSIAREIVDEFKAEHPGDWRDYEDEMSDRTHEYVDGHEYVIYNYQALMTCAHCNTDDGEEFLEDIGMPETPTIYSLASTIVYGEMRARVTAEISRLIEEEPHAWSAGFNMPGYMPDNEPFGFDDWAEARDYLESELSRYAEESPEHAESIDETVTRLGDLDENAEFGETVGAYHFWLTRA